jgi:hypothetical protein
VEITASGTGTKSIVKRLDGVFAGPHIVRGFEEGELADSFVLESAALTAGENKADIQRLGSDPYSGGDR